MSFVDRKQDIKQDSCKTRTGTQKVIVKLLLPRPLFLFFYGGNKKILCPKYHLLSKYFRYRCFHAPFALQMVSKKKLYKNLAINL